MWLHQRGPGMQGLPISSDQEEALEVFQSLTKIVAGDCQRAQGSMVLEGSVH
jgi:hypothetical protein